MAKRHNSTFVKTFLKLLFADRKTQRLIHEHLMSGMIQVFKGNRNDMNQVLELLWERKGKRSTIRLNDLVAWLSEQGISVTRSNDGKWTWDGIPSNRAKKQKETMLKRLAQNPYWKLQDEHAASKAVRLVDPVNSIARLIKAFGEEASKKVLDEAFEAAKSTEVKKPIDEESESKFRQKYHKVFEENQVTETEGTIEEIEE